MRHLPIGSGRAGTSAVSSGSTRLPEPRSVMPRANSTACRARSSMLTLTGCSSDPPNSDTPAGSPRARRSTLTATSKSRPRSEADGFRLPCSMSVSNFSMPLITALWLSTAILACRFIMSRRSFSCSRRGCFSKWSSYCRHRWTQLHFVESLLRWFTFGAPSVLCLASAMTALLPSHGWRKNTENYVMFHRVVGLTPVFLRRS